MSRPYQEYGSTFTHQGDEYDLNRLFRITQGRKATMVPMKKLEWILQYGEPDEDRVDAADPSIPILVVITNGIYYELDGFHRLTKAKRQGLKQIPCIIVTNAELASAKLRATHQKGHVLEMNSSQDNYIAEMNLRHRMLVTESMSIETNIGSIRNKLGAVAKSLTGFITDRVKPQAAMSLINYSMALREISQVRYTDVNSLKITVPRGLKVTLPEYVQGISAMVAFAEMLERDILIPFNTWLALRVAAPASLADASTVTDLKNFREHDIETFRAHLLKMADPISRVDSLPLEKVFPNLSSIQPTWNDINSLTSRYLATNPGRVVKITSEIAQKVNRLVEIIKDEQSGVKLSEQTITILSGICWKMAEEVDFYGILGALLREVTTAGNYEAQELKQAFKHAAANNKKNGIVVESLVDEREVGFEFKGKWFSEENLRNIELNIPQEDVHVDALAWALEYTNTEPLPNAGFDANAHVTAVRYGDRLYPLMGLDYLATLKASGVGRVSVCIMEEKDLFPEGVI